MSIDIGLQYRLLDQSSLIQGLVDLWHLGHMTTMLERHLNACLRSAIRTSACRLSVSTDALKTHSQGHRGGLRLGHDHRRLGKLGHRGLPNVAWQFTFAMAAYDLIRLPKRLPAPS